MESDHPHHRLLSLDDIQTIIGRAVVDPDFRKAFTANPEETVKRLGITLEHEGTYQAQAGDLLRLMAEALSNDSSSLQELIDQIRKAYEGATDGVIRPRCG